MFRKRIIDDATGKTLAVTFMDSWMSVWPWAVECVAQLFECREEDVDCVEIDGISMITARGTIVARLR